MCHSVLSEDLANLHAGEILAVALGAPILLFALELEDDRLFAAALFLDGARHASAAYSGASLNGVAVRDRQDTTEFYRGSHVAGEAFDFQRLTGGDAILLSAGFDD